LLCVSLVLSVMNAEQKSEQAVRPELSSLASNPPLSLFDQTRSIENTLNQKVARTLASLVGGNRFQSEVHVELVDGVEATNDSEYLDANALKIGRLAVLVVVGSDVQQIVSGDIQSITELIQAAVGFDSQRGDTVKVAYSDFLNGLSGNEVAGKREEESFLASSAYIIALGVSGVGVLVGVLVLVFGGWSHQLFPRPHSPHGFNSPNTNDSNINASNINTAEGDVRLTDQGRADKKEEKGHQAQMQQDIQLELGDTVKVSEHTGTIEVVKALVNKDSGRAAQVIKNWIRNKKPVTGVRADSLGTNVSSLTATAMLLLSIGEQTAARLLKGLEPRDVRVVGVAMSEVTNLKQEQVLAVASEFIQDFRNQASLEVKPDEYIKSVFSEALGEEVANSLVDRIFIGRNAPNLEALKWMDGSSVADLIRNEHPQVQAVVISYLDADQAAEVLGRLEEAVRTDVMIRIAELESIQPRALNELNQVIQSLIASSTSASIRKIGGVKCAADIVNQSGADVEGVLMGSIMEVDADLGAAIEEQTLEFDRLKDMNNRCIQSLLKEVSHDVLVTALKGADTDLQEKFFNNMSRRVSQALREDLEAKGPVKISEVDDAQRDILTIVRRLAESGELIIGRDGEEVI